MESFFVVAQQVGVLFALMSVGFVCRRNRLFDDRVIKGLVDILVLIVTPCLVVNAFQRPFSMNMLHGLVFTAVIAIVAHVVAIALSYPFFHHSNCHSKNILRVSAVFSNAGFMGIPLDYALMGTEGVFYGVLYVGVFNVVMWSWGLCTIRNIRTKELFGPGIKTMFVNPGTIGLAMGLPLFFSSTTLPSVLHDSVGFISELNTPLAMFVIGYYLAGAKLGPVLRTPMAYWSAAFRLLVFPLGMIGALYLLKNTFALEYPMMITLVVSASAPVAALTSMLAAKYDSDVDLSVGMVSGTTLLSMLTMPIVVGFGMQVLK